MRHGKKVCFLCSRVLIHSRRRNEGGKLISADRKENYTNWVKVCAPTTGLTFPPIRRSARTAPTSKSLSAANTDMATPVATVSSDRISSNQGDAMIDDGHGAYESARMEPVGQSGTVEEAGNTIVDGMGIMDEMMMNGGGDNIDRMGIADGELEMVADEFDLQVAQWPNVRGQVDGVSDQPVQSTHDVGSEIEMQEQSAEQVISAEDFLI